MRNLHFISSVVLLGSSGLLIPTAEAALDATDPSIINLYLLNDQVGSNPYNNSVAGQFKDTAVTGTPQNHDDLSAPSPVWTDTGAIGTGTGLAFSRSGMQYTRFSGWMSTPQGAFSDGNSFSVMVRLNAASLMDGQTYDVIGMGSHAVSLAGISTPNSGLVNVRVRDQNTFWTLNSAGDTNGVASSGPNFSIKTDEWVNVFLIYSADANPGASKLTVAMDNGTTFASQVATGGPAGFDTIAEGFDNPGVHWFLGSTGSFLNTFDGVIESVAIWDHAISLASADAVDFATVPEPTSLLAAGLGGLMLLRRRR